MTSEQECFVYIVPPGQTEFVTVGKYVLAEKNDGGYIGRFIYGNKWLENPDAVPLDPVELTLQDKTHETANMGGFFGAIRDSMPDSWGRRVLEHNLGLGNVNEFDYLLKGPDDCAGALGFGRNQNPPFPEKKFNRTLDLARLQEIADAIIVDDPTLAGSAAKQVEELFLLGTSMGGARPKTVVEDNNELWLAKFGRNDDRWNNPRVEHGLLALAKLCGINAAPSKIVTIADRDVLLVRRFDRAKSENGNYFRYRQISALTLLRSAENDHQKWSYISLADEVRRASCEPRTDLTELFKRMCFNALTSNLDDHPRNHALIATQHTWRLSPAYDLTPTPVISKEHRNLAMICGSNGRYANRANLLSECGRFLLSDNEAMNILNTMQEVINSQWQSAMIRAGITNQDLNRISNAFLYDGFFY